MTVDYGTNPNFDHWVSDNPVLHERQRTEGLTETTLNLDKISNNQLTIKTENDNYIDIDELLDAGEAASRVINGALNNTKKRKSTSRNQALAVTQSYISRAEERSVEVEKQLAPLRKLHKMASLTDSDKRVDLLTDGESASDMLELVGFFAMELDRHFKLNNSDENSYVSVLFKAIDDNDGEAIMKFISAARANTAARVDKYKLQEQEFGYFLAGLNGEKPEDYKKQPQYRYRQTDIVDEQSQSGSTL